ELPEQAHVGVEQEALEQLQVHGQAFARASENGRHGDVEGRYNSTNCRWLFLLLSILHQRPGFMSTIVEAPVDLIEAVANLRLPAQTDSHLQMLMDRNNNGQLTIAERREFEELVEWSE